MKPATPDPSPRKAAVGLLLLLVLQALLSWDFTSFASLFEWQPESWLFPALAGLSVVLAGRISSLLLWPLAAWCGLLLLVRLGEFSLMTFFGREIDLKWDIWMLPNLRDLVVHTVGGAAAWGLLLVSVLLFLLLVALLMLILKGTTLVLNRPGRLAAWILLPVLLLALERGKAAPSQSHRLFTAMAEAWYFHAYQDAVDQILVEARGKQLGLPTDLGRLDGADVLIFFVESYGRIAWDAPAYRKRLLPKAEALGNAFKEAGYHVGSRFVRSPVMGGGSWLAHASFLTGVNTQHQILWERLLQSPIRPLPGFFRDKGYETVSVMPAMKIEEWPEGTYFEFTRDLWFHDFGYDHHGFHWSPMADQFALVRFDELVLQSTEKPVFAEFVLTSSHAPFAVVPAFHEGEWSREGVMRTLRSRPMRLFENDYHHLEEGPEGYATALLYSLRSITDFITRHYKRDGLIIIIGDHQPMAFMPGTDTRDVPLHFMTRDAEIMERLRQNGFSAAWSPDPGRPSLPMEDVMELFLRSVSDPNNEDRQRL
ncbi:MAG: hypothetical protein GVY10_00560 [Verrucomicrobia bacterium]|jgi:hypothetical protein|nr:hypothetical protein [Verrucomicrobiota bacterium]